MGDTFAANRYSLSAYLSWLTYFGYHTLSCKQTRATPSEDALYHLCQRLRPSALLFHLQPTSIRPFFRGDTVSIAHTQPRGPRLQPTPSTTRIPPSPSHHHHQQQGLERLLQNADRCGSPPIADQAFACTATEPIACHKR